MFEAILQSLIVTFISLFVACFAVAIVVGYLINKASEAGGPGFLSTDLRDADNGGPAAAASTEVGARGSRDFTFRGSTSKNSGSEDGPGGPVTTSELAVKASACAFCAWVRKSLLRRTTG